jgi:uncharacterized protein YqeY
MISDNIKKQIKEAMKAKDVVRLSTLKMLSAALTNAEIEKKREKLTKEEEIKVVQSEAKKRKDAIELYVKGAAVDKAEKEKKELEVLQEFLPKQMSDDELTKIVDKAIKEMNAQSTADLGKVMGAVMGKTKGIADGKRVSEMVRERLK